jgi:hypothetical protein
MNQRVSSSLSNEVQSALKGNIFHAARRTINDWDSFAWHIGRNGNNDTHQKNSSQAFCLSFWGTLATVEGRHARAAVAQMFSDDFLRKALTSVDGDLALAFEYDSRDLLNEHGGTQSHLDVVLSLADISLVVESKLTEKFGWCSQVKARNCSGTYGPGSDLKLRKDSACRLEYQDRHRTPRVYWDVMKSISAPGAYETGGKCPFAEGGYQVMRNVAAAVCHGRERGVDWRVIFAYPWNQHTDLDIEKVVRRLTAENQSKVLRLDYFRVAETLSMSPDPIARDLSGHMAARLRLLRPLSFGSLSVPQRPR